MELLQVNLSYESSMRKEIGVLCSCTLSRLVYGTTNSPPSHVERSVSSKTMTPEMYCESPGVVKSIFRYRMRFPSVFSKLTASKRLPIVCMLSSAARMPFPCDAILFCARISTCTTERLRSIFQQNTNMILVYIPVRAHPREIEKIFEIGTRNMISAHTPSVYVCMHKVL